MPDAILQKQFQELQEQFLTYTQSDELLPDELTRHAVFFQAPQVQSLIEFGAKNNEFLMPIVETFRSIETMGIFRGCLVGYLIGLYGESDISCQQTDQALGDFFENILSLDEKYMALVCEKLGTSPEKLNHDEDLLNAFYDFSPESLLDSHPDLVHAWMGTEILSLGFMSRISSNRTLREQLRAKDQVASRCAFMGEYRDNINFIPYILNMVEEENVLLISPSTGNGVEVCLKEIDTNNVFFTLLQFALYHEGLLESLGAAPFTYREVIERIAKHEYVSEEEWPEQLYEQGCFSYYTYSAWNPDGTFNEMGTVWGEGSLKEVPKLDGRYVILLTRPNIQRSWGNAFICSTHSRLNPRVEIVRRLSKEETADWLEKVRTFR